MRELDEYTNRIKEGEQAISATIAYLLGIDITYIKQMPAKMTYIPKLNNNKHARIIRNLCILRTDLMKNYNQICCKIKTDYVSIRAMPALVSDAANLQLEKDGVTWYRKSNTLLEHHISEINRIISDRINNCKDLFPLWLEWNYVRKIFIMPNGLTKQGVREELGRYWANQRYYPYQAYLNWEAEDAGNILYDDRKIMETLYRQNERTFTDMAKVCDIGGFTEDRIYDFIKQSKKLVIAVDCENSDPYKLCAALRGLAQPDAQKISKIILVDDVNTGALWKGLEEYISIPVEYKLVERVTKFKSLVDTTLTATVSKEHYLNGVDSFILVSSDSDYWGMITSLTSAKFLLMVERDNLGEQMKAVLRDSGVFFCYLDDFYAGNTTEIKYGVLRKEIRRRLTETINLNINTLLTSAIQTLRAEMTEAERRQFYEKYLRRPELTVDTDGNLSVTI